MTSVLKEAIKEIRTLAAEDQEMIGRQMLQHMEKLRLLREDIDAGLNSLKAGKGRSIDMRKLVTKTRQS